MLHYLQAFCIWEIEKKKLKKMRIGAAIREKWRLLISILFHC